jgi:Flp pilus assembly protein TadG
VAVPFGLSLVLLAASVGGAIDFNRWHNAKRVTGDAIDAAVLAGARTLQLNPTNTQAALDTANAFFQRNVEGKVDLSVNTVSFALTDNNQALAATGMAKIDATFLRAIGLNQLTVLSDAGSNMPKARITFGSQGGSNLELSLVLDVTGSMCNDGVGPCTSSTRMDGLKAAAKNLIDTVVAANQTTYYSKMAIVPFSTRVRVGPDGGGGGIMKALTDLNPVWSGHYKMCSAWTGSGGGSETNGSWTCTAYTTQYYTNWKIMPCVTDRFYNNIWDLDYTDEAPGSHRWINAHDGGRMTKSWDSSNTSPTTHLGTAELPAEHWNYDTGGQCADVAQSNEIMALSTDKDALKAKIDGLSAYGSTAGALGTAWGWYTLSPRWHNIWTGNKRPGDYSELTNIQTNGKPALRKVVVIMTDGVYNTYRGWKDQDQQTVSNYAKQLCTNMKTEGIEVFTVGLALDQLTPSERAIATDTLQSCGTDLSHFYSTLDVTELQQAFQDIAYQLSGVTLTR